MTRFLTLTGITAVMLAVLWVQPTRSSQAHKPAPPPRPPAELLRLSLAAEKEGLAEPFKGVTTKGQIEPNLFEVRSTGVSTEPVRVAASAFLASLTPEQRRATAFPVEADEWRKWMNQSFYVRQGVSFQDMTASQRDAAFALLGAGLSAKGLTLTRDIMRLNHTLGELNDNNFEEYGEWLYHLTVMGTPSATEPWGWQFDGHHAIINYFVLGDQVVMTPSFAGSEPATAPSGKYKGTSIFRDEQQRALTFVNGLAEAQRTKAVLSVSKTGNNILTEAWRDNVVLDYAGLRATELTEAQRRQLLDLVALYVANMDEGHARVRMDDVRRHLDRTWFAWIGKTEPGSVFYYRIHSPVILIEFDHNRPANLRHLAADPLMPNVEHIHTIVRTPNGNDYGKDLLRQHYLRHPHTAASAGQQTDQHDHGAPSGRLGTVHFATSCVPAVQQEFDRGIALLHSFWFSAAIESFDTVLKGDPRCVMAHWGIAMSWWSNPFGGFRSPQALKAGLAAVDAAKASGAGTEREKAYVAAVEHLYRDASTVDQRTRIVAYEKAMEALSATYPDDVEARIFYALALDQSALPSDKTYANQLKAAAILEQEFTRQPEHPGLAHYIIHSFDVPALAPRALDAARRYAKIAPDAAHALHMPSHTFTRVGSWEESIETNRASAAAARKDNAVAEELHALDYQAYAYLQTAQDAAARRTLEGLDALGGRIDTGGAGNAAPPTAGYYAWAAIPARYALEREAWAEAAALTPRQTRFAWPDAVTHFARALGAARSGNTAAARQDIDRLAAIHDTVEQAKDAYWAGQVEIQRRAATAWVSLAEGRQAEALTLMREAADMEDATEKAAVTPGPLKPARELLGEMLLQLGQPAEALVAFEATLKKEPNRFRATYGAARAAEAAGQRETASTYYASLLTIAKGADQPGRKELAEAREKSAAR